MDSVKRISDLRSRSRCHRWLCRREVNTTAQHQDSPFSLKRTQIRQMAQYRWWTFMFLEIGIPFLHFSYENVSLSATNLDQTHELNISVTVEPHPIQTTCFSCFYLAILPIPWNVTVGNLPVPDVIDFTQPNNVFRNNLDSENRNAHWFAYISESWSR